MMKKTISSTATLGVLLASALTATSAGANAHQCTITAPQVFCITNQGPDRWFRIRQGSCHTPVFVTANGSACVSIPLCPGSSPSDQAAAIDGAGVIVPCERLPRR